MSDIRPGRGARARRDPNNAAEHIYAAVVAAQRADGDIPLCAALEKLAAGTGQNKFRHAAQIVRGKTVGRKAFDDRAALRRIREWPAHRKASAVMSVAKDVAPPGADDKGVRTIARRLRRKLLEEKRRKLLTPPPAIVTNEQSGETR